MRITSPRGFTQTFNTSAWDEDELADFAAAKMLAGWTVEEI